MSPIGISTPKDLINYFNKIQGKGLVSGEFIETGDPASVTIDPLTTLQANTGQFVGMIAIDYWHAGGTGSVTTANANADAIAQWQAGGLVEVNAAMPNPTTGGAATDTSDLDVAGLLTPGTATNNALNANLSQVAGGLRQLQDAGVVVVYRPYWEMNGNWNWWGAGLLSAQEFQALWQYTYNYMTDTMGLHNLVWMYAINGGFALPDRSLTDTYPGAAFVDMTGQDMYSNNPGIDGQSTYQALLALGKPTALAEFGSGAPSGGDPSFSMPTLISQIQTYMPNTVYWMQWWAQNAGGNGWGIEQDQNASAALNDGYVINRGQIANTAPQSSPAVSASASDTVVTDITSAITDASGNQWTITSSAQVAVNGVADTSTWNVIELAYVNGMIWHENTAQLWWGKTSPDASWAPGAGTATSPLPSAPATPPMPAVSADDATVIAGSASAITDASGNQWTITSSAQVAVNGVADTSTWNVIELAYVNGMIWHENTAQLWWGKTSPDASWAPGAGTATSPLPSAPATPPMPAVSADDATVIAGSASAITDASGNQWTITSSAQVAVNGVADTSTWNVIELAYVNGMIWHENTAQLWWGKTSPDASWAPGAGTATSPLPSAPATPPMPAVSADDATVIAGSASAITDASGNQWTITSSAQVAVNGVADTSTWNVIELAYVNGMIWHENTAQLWWGKTSPDASWAPGAGTATSPLPSAPATPPMPAVSADDATVIAGSASAITDASGNQWTITSSAQVAVNGVADTSTWNVIELAYVNGMIWHENTAQLWWGKTSPDASWAPGAGTATSPLPSAPATPPMPAVSADDATVIAGSASAITDASGNQWTITSSAQVAVNGVADTSTWNVIELAYVNGMIWHENTAQLWWGKTSPDASWAPGAGTATSPLLQSITIAATSATDTVSQSQVSIVATAGNHMVFVTGTGNALSLSGGVETVNDTGGANTYTLPASGHGRTLFTSDILTIGDTLDLRTVLAATNWNGMVATLPDYLTVVSSAHGAHLSVAATSYGTGVTIATIQGATDTTLNSLLAHSIV